MRRTELASPSSPARIGRPLGISGRLLVGATTGSWLSLPSLTFASSPNRAPCLQRRLPYSGVPTNALAPPSGTSRNAL